MTGPANSASVLGRTGRMPNMVQAGMYSATLQYLKAVKAAGTKDADAVAKKLKSCWSTTPSLRTATCRPTDGWSATSICSRSRSHRKANATGTIATRSRRCPATRPIRPPPTAAAH